MFKLLSAATLLLLSSYGLIANAQQPEQTDSYTTQACPASFYSVPLQADAKFCQIFAESMPASISYFAPSTQQQARAFFIAQLGEADSEQSLHGRIVLQYAGGQTVLVISEDGQGTQIDMLIKSSR